MTCQHPAACKKRGYGRLCRSCHGKQFMRGIHARPGQRERNIARLQTPTACAARIAALREVGKDRTGWCPEPFREDYARIRKKVGAAEARRIIEVEIARGLT